MKANDLFEIEKVQIFDKLTGKRIKTNWNYFKQ